MKTSKESNLKANEMSNIKNELKEFLDNRDLANLFFDGEVGESDNFKKRWLECDDAYTDLQNMITAGFDWEIVADVGGEGEGETYYKVYKFTKGGEDYFVKFDGSYYSYDGATYDDYCFVNPKQKTITVYE